MFNCLIHFYKRFQIKLILPGPRVDLIRQSPRRGGFLPDSCLVDPEQEGDQFTGIESEGQENTTVSLSTGELLV